METVNQLLALALPLKYHQILMDLIILPGTPIWMKILKINLTKHLILVKSPADLPPAFDVHNFTDPRTKKHCYW